MGIILWDMLTLVPTLVFPDPVIRRGVPERVLQTFLGHADARSTPRYARISEHALIAVLRPRVGGLSVDENAVGKCLKKRDIWWSQRESNPCLQGENQNKRPRKPPK